MTHHVIGDQVIVERSGVITPGTVRACDGRFYLITTPNGNRQWYEPSEIVSPPTVIGPRHTSTPPVVHDDELPLAWIIGGSVLLAIGVLGLLYGAIYVAVWLGTH